MAMYQRMQDLRSVDATTAQRVEDAIDITQYGQVVLQVRVPVAGTGGAGVQLDLDFQHAAVPEEDAFVDITGMTVDLLVAGTFTVSNHGEPLLRYLRWRVTEDNLTTGAQFLIDLVARER